MAVTHTLLSRIPPLTLLMFFSLIPSARPDEKTAATALTPDQLMKVKQVGSVQVSPDGKRVAFTVRQAVMDNDKSEYRTHIHLVNSDGSEAMQLTQGDVSCDQPRWSPD